MFLSNYLFTFYLIVHFIMIMLMLMMAHLTIYLNRPCQMWHTLPFDYRQWHSSARMLSFVFESPNLNCHRERVTLMPFLFRLIAQEKSVHSCLGHSHSRNDRLALNHEIELQLYLFLFIIIN